MDLVYLGKDAPWPQLEKVCPNNHGPLAAMDYDCCRNNKPLPAME